MSFAALLDERTRPSVRETIGRLLAAAHRADIAIAQLRLAGLDLQPSEAGGIERCRLMIGRFDAAMLHDAGSSVSARGQLELLAAFAASGRLEIRTAPHHVWNPDFSVFTELPGNDAAVLLGAHYFGRPYPLHGLAFTCVLRNPDVVASCARRFEELWQAGYDVLPVIAATLSELLTQ